MKVVAAALLVAGCGRVGFDATASSGGDGGGGDGSGSDQSCTVPATRTVHAGDNFYGLLATLGPGEVVEVESGTYTSPGFAPMTWNGTLAEPIVVRAAMGARPVLVNAPGSNNLDLSGSYFTLRGFELMGGDIGVRVAGDHETLDDLYIHDVNDQGITCNRPNVDCSALTIRRTEIAGTLGTTGSGITLGCSDDSCSVANAVIEGVYVHDLMGSAGAGVSVWKHDGVVVRDNVFVMTQGPGIVLQETTLGAADVLERNLIHNIADNGIQIEGQAIVRNNIIYNVSNDGIQSRSQTTVTPTGVRILHNTIINATNVCIAGSNWVGSSNIVANNALECANGTMLSGTPITSANVGVTAADIGAPGNVYPTASSNVIDQADGNIAAADDFNGTPRTGAPDIGAYERTTPTNPGWLPQDGLKPIASDCP